MNAALVSGLSRPQGLEKLTAFLEIESTIGAAERPEDCGGREIKFDKLSPTKLVVQVCEFVLA